MRIAKVSLIMGLIAVCGLTANAGDAVWLTNFEKAKKIAVKKNMLILADFTGSDWCPWCVKLDKEVFSQKAFKDYVKGKFVLLKLDFPRRKTLSADLKAQNNKLAKKYGIGGFPTILILDAKGAKIAQGGYMQGGPDAFIGFLKQVRAKVTK